MRTIIKKRALSILITTFFLSAFVQSAHALQSPATEWTRSLASSSEDTVLMNPTNGPIVKSCNPGASQHIQVFNPNGTINYWKSQNATGRVDVHCAYAYHGDWGSVDESANITSSGTFITTGNADSSAWTDNRVQAYTSGTLNWTYNVKNECNQPASISTGPITYGNVVAFLYESCNSNGGYSLRTLNMFTGAALNTAYIGRNATSPPPVIWYKGGFIIPLSSNQVKFVNSSGNLDAAKSFDVITDNILAYSPQGDVIYKLVNDSDPTKCSIVYRSLTASQVNRPIKCSDIPVVIKGTIAMNGDIIGQLSSDNGVNPFANPTIRIIRKTGSQIFTDIKLSLPKNENGLGMGIPDFEVDYNGNIVVLGSYRDADGIDRANVYTFSSSGSALGVWESSIAPKKTDTPFYVTNTSLTIANGAIYVVDFNGKQLIKISAPEISLSYRDAMRWNMAGVVQAPKLKYVALGDSYSSGEGAGDYAPKSNMPTVNECHRSTNAYPHLLGADMSRNIQFDVFAACSGAVMSNITANGQWGEPAQSSWVTPAANIVTVSIGGNDLKFSDTMMACVKKHDKGTSVLTQDQYDKQQCLAAVNASQIILRSAAFRTTLQNTYKSIVSRGNSSTKFYIVGYPNILTAYNNFKPDCRWMFWLAPRAEFTNRLVSQDEVTAFRNLSSEISSLMSATVSGLNDPDVKYVDVRPAFDGHELCSKEPYLNADILSAEPTYMNQSYHPSALGQRVYADTILKAMK